jgi:hypothetical protein
MDLVDLNWSLSVSVIHGSEAKRPAETAGDRLRWLLTATHVHFHDYGNVTYPTHQMDAYDYTGMRPNDVLADIAVEGGYNFWCERNEAHEAAELFFLDPNGSSYNSTLAISNDAADLDLAAIRAGTATTYPPFHDAILTRSASRITYGCFLPYQNGWVYKVNETTGLQYAFIDQEAPMATVSTQARANRIAAKFLSDNDSEDDVIEFSFIVPAAKVNDMRAGHRFAAKFTHLPGYESVRYLRVTRQTIRQDPDLSTDNYLMEIEASPAGSEVAGSPVTICNNLPARSADTGATPPSSGVAITPGATYHWTVTQPLHEPGCHTIVLVIEADLTSGPYTYFSGGTYGPVGPGGSGPAVDTGGTFTVPSSGAGSTGYFRFRTNTDGYADPNDPPFGNDCWTFTIERIA